MAEETSAEKTEQPTPRRLTEARKKGQLPRSRELVSFFVSLTGVLGLVAISASVPAFLQQGLIARLEFDASDLLRAEPLTEPLKQTIFSAIIWLLPLLILATIGAVLGSIALGGWNLSAEAMKPDFSRLNLFKGLKRMVSAQGMAELGKGLAKFVLLGAILCLMLWHGREELLALGRMPLGVGMETGAWWVFSILAALCGGLLLIAGVDAPFQLWQHRKRMLMSRQEVRDDQKQTEGRPEVKQRQRAEQQAASSRRMRQLIPEADVVICNPQHYAVALQYRADEMAAPKLLFKGQGELVKTMRELAKQNQIPIVTAPPLARSIFHFVKEGEGIPSALFVAVAEVLGYVYQLQAQPAETVPEPSPQVPKEWRWSPDEST